MHFTKLVLSRMGKVFMKESIKTIKTMKILNLEQLATNIFNDVLNGSTGGTYNIDGTKVDYQTGYFVGIKGFNVPKMYFINPKYPINILTMQLNDSFDLINLPFVGYWVNDNIVYIDSVAWTENLNHAVNLGKLYDQIAIFDIKNLTDIKL
jgi:hypothetical protein